MRYWISLTILLALAGCSSTPAPSPRSAPAQLEGKTICDSYIILDMCVRDLVGDGTVDMVYFSDTYEIFMYQKGRRELVAKVMPFHRCAVTLSPGMQSITNRILGRKDMGFVEEVSITKDLIANFVAARSEIDACNARFEDGDTSEEEEFFMGDAEWINEPFPSSPQSGGL